jgi:phosphatidylglycerol:prolipoprotein diacylglycerol transferase
MEHYAICFPVGLGSVRVGNFMGGELLGRPTEVSWGVIFLNDPEGLLRHPSQLYQAFSEGFILFILLYLFAQTNPPRWSLAGLFLSGYAVVRIFTENFRTPDAHIGFDLLEIFTRGQLLSLPMLIIGISLMIFAYRKKPS